jgi:anti-sigma factor RsiW
VNDERADLNELLEELANEEHRREPAHLTSDDLRSYLRGGMTAEEHAQAQDHLALCRHCATLLLDLGGFAQPKQPAGTNLSDAEVASAWTQTKAILARHRSGGLQQPVERGRVLQAFFRPAHAWATAASLLIALLAIGAWSLNLYRENGRLADALGVGAGRRDQPAPTGSVPSVAAYEQQVAELRQQVDTLSQPQPNVLVFDLYPADATRSSSSDVATMNVPAGANLITLILNIAAEHEYRDYSVDVLDQSGTRIWQGERLRKTAFGNFTLMVPRRFLPEGRYRIQLRGVGGGQATVIEQYVVRVRYP